MNFIEQIFKGKTDEKAHWKFIKYGRGKFPGPILEITKLAKGVKVNGSFDYAETLAELILKNYDGDFRVTGKLFSREEIKDELSNIGVEIQKKSKKGKLKVYQIKTEINSEILKKLYALDAGVLLSLEPSDKNKITANLKSKAAVPKPGDAVDNKFCSAVYDISMLDKIMDELCFDIKDKNFKKIKISHEYMINDVILPEGVDDPAQIRLLAKRKGKLIRSIIVDGGEEIIKEGTLLV